jgi:thiol-disulfide isomerase/thioredoxin
MKTLLIFQLAGFIIAAGVFGGLTVSEDVYTEVQQTIVKVLCLSCIKLTPTTDINFTFDTIFEGDHPSFIIENLSKGVVFLAFRADVCEACDIMEPHLKDIFEINFEKEETIVVTKTFNGINVTLIHISINHSPKYLIDSYELYDYQQVSGVPMFVWITYGYDRGFIKPYYATGYGTLQQNTGEEQQQQLLEIIDDAVELYKQNNHGSH